MGDRACVVHTRREGAGARPWTDRLTELVRIIGAAGGAAQAYEVDVTNADDVREVVTAIGDEHGRIDVLVNNAGFLANGPAIGADLADWHRMIDVNVGGS